MTIGIVASPTRMWLIAISHVTSSTWTRLTLTGCRTYGVGYNYGPCCLSNLHVTSDYRPCYLSNSLVIESCQPLPLIHDLLLLGSLPLQLTCESYQPLSLIHDLWLLALLPLQLTWKLLASPTYTRLMAIGLIMNCVSNSLYPQWRNGMYVCVCLCVCSSPKKMFFFSIAFG